MTTVISVAAGVLRQQSGVLGDDLLGHGWVCGVRTLSGFPYFP